jgi:YD repeat-containing protein
MSFGRGSAAALGLVVLLACTTCSSDSPSGTTATNSTVGQVCRSYPSAYTTTASDGSSFSTSCSVDRTLATLNCGGPYGETVRAYNSLSDFVDEGQFMGRTLATSEQSRGHLTSYAYDDQRRLARWVETYSDRSFNDKEESVATAWDALGRPTVATTTSTITGPQSGNPPPTTCTNTFTYDDVARTVKRSACATGTQAVSETYDANFFRVSFSGTTYEVEGTFQICR